MWRCLIRSIVLLFLAIWSTGGHSQETELGPGKAVERKLADATPHSYKVDLVSGQYLEIAIEQTRGTLSVRLLGPGGDSVAEAKDWSGSGKAVRISLLVKATGAYRLEVRPSSAASGASYRLSVTQLRPATAEDHERVSAEAAVLEADHLRTQGTAESVQRSLELYKATLPVWHAAGDPIREAYALTFMGIIYRRTGEPQRAIESHRSALELLHAAGDQGAEGDEWGSLALVYFELGDPDKALEYYERCLALVRQAGYRASEGITLSNMANVYLNIGDLPKALGCYNQALAVRREVGDRRGEAVVLIGMGSVYNLLGEPQQALEHTLRGLELSRQLEDRYREANALGNISAIYQNTGEFEKSVEYRLKALELYKTGGNRRDEALTISSLGGIYAEMGEPRKALEYADQALPLLRTVGSPTAQAGTLDNKGSAYAQLGEWKLALESFSQALPLWHELKDRRNEANSLISIGGVYISSGEFGKAIDSLDQAAAMLRATGDPVREAKALYLLARAERALGNRERALEEVSRAIELDESVRSAAGQDLRAAYFANVRSQYELQIGLLMDLHRSADALRVSERARARSLLELLRESHVDFRQGVASDLLERERSLQALLRGKSTRQMRLLAAKHTEEQASAAEAEIQGLTTEYEHVEAEIRAKSPRYSALTQPEPLAAADIQKQILDPDTILLEYALADDGSFLWMVTPSSLQGFKLPKRSEVESAARRAFSALSSAESSDPNALTALSQIVLGPVADRIRSKRLIVVADGALQYIPFAALPDPTGNQPLMVEHEIVSLPSASTLGLLRRELAGRRPAPKTVAVLADPVFGSGDPRVSGEQQASAPDANLQRSVMETGLLSISRLSSTRREADAIVALAQRGQSLEALDFDASRETATSTALAQYRIVHFASHGLLNAVHPELSGIVLSLVDRHGQPRNGFLQAHEVYNLKLGADLVVLSACQTALGKDVRGEGLVGLTRGFMYAGAPRVVAGLWRVPDRATAELMTRFYHGMLADHLTPAAALRQAQISIWKEGRWARPYYWAAFTIQGEWR